MVLADIATLAVSLVILSKASTLVVQSASKLARFFGISHLAVGLFLIAASTSFPELSVSVASSIAGEGALSAGNVFGSNIANILLILGLGSFVYGFKVKREELPDLALVLLMTTLISVYIVFHSIIASSALGFYEGLALIAVGVWYSIRILREKGTPELDGEEHVTKKEGLEAFLWFTGSIVLVIISSGFVVSSALGIAQGIGLAKSFVGATIIAIGTSLPELSVCLEALRQKEYGLALGNAIGSNMINLTLVLGVAAAISPIFVQLQVFIVALLMAVIANMVFFYIAVMKKKFDRNDSIVLLGLYIVYFTLIFFLQLREAG